MKIETDYLILGSGIAGLTVAIKLAEQFPDRKILIVTKSNADESNTKYAQGGIAVVIDGIDDDFEKFIKDCRQMGLAQFLETYQKDTLGINYWVEKLVLWETDRPDGHEAKQALGMWLLKLKEMETFHQPSATKWTLFYDLLKTHVFPRAITLT